MIVVDASCVVEIILRRPKYAAISERLLSGEELCAPHLIDIEACHAIRRLWLDGDISAARGQAALEDLADAPIKRLPHVDLIASIWKLRTNLSAYDAAYVALAEALDAPLATCDKKLAAAAGQRIQVNVF
jgi:predicted nucleic acid-binding protein